ncbi:MJ0042-type zinc finger domain-containing protein [Pseudorhodoplanes sp.]|uniref:MJ0042-type zinc finger domain-containing protein n=1 Tax=Pseudorhodoplanes sp. TaxID=1934341 RepID=UPI002D80C78C|nr:MJ0042-type zinc finger domain-containing protein [Pseudorhodoplanes sp.]
MLIVCPNCATSYQVTPESLGETGRTVRCVSCHNLWFEQPAPALPEEPAMAGTPALDPMLIRPPLNDVVDIGAAQTGLPEFPNDRQAAIEPARTLPNDLAPPIVPEIPQRETPKAIERFAAKVATKRPAPHRRPLSHHALPALICVLGMILVCLLAARQQVVRWLPQTASLYASIGLPVNLRGLAFEDIKTSREVQDGVPTLIVEGRIVGTTRRHTEVPRLRLAVTDQAGREIYAWIAQPPRDLLPPGETLPFRSRLASPPPDASGVTVRFFNRRDRQAGLM